jgi:outer membrane protein TolC
MNEMLMEIGRAYFALVGAHAMLANANDALASSKKMVKLATDFADAGAGARAEVYRAQTELAHWQRAVHAAEREIGTSGAELARLLRMGRNVRLMPVDPQIAPVELLDESTPVSQLIETALMSRPELAEHQSLVEAAIWRMRQECVRPWLPMIQLGASAGSFGGGAGTAFAADGSRSDVDLLAVWELKNLGLGHRALKSRRSSQLRQAEIEAEEIQNLIVSQVVKAATAVAGYRREINAARKGLVAAKKSYVANLARIREGEGQPLEMLQAARARANAQNALTEAITEYNRAQMSLLRALGQPPGAPAE